jgi:hypothetical protein
MTRLRAALVKLLDTVTVALQRLLGAVRGPAIHILVTGPDVSGMRAIAAGVAEASSSLKVYSGRAAETSNSFRRVVISSSLDDLTDSAGVMATVGRFRRMVVVAATADPREMVCAKDSRLPYQWPDGFDYRFLFGPDGTKSFTEPGVLPRYAGLDEWKATALANVVTVSREELSSDTSAALARVTELLPPGLGEVARRLSTLGISLPKLTSWSNSKESTTRVVQQVALAPELETRAGELGYPALRSITKARAPKVNRGTIVAFHTPDEVYRAEAARLKKTLDALGLDYHFFEVTPEKNWVRTTLLKPSWILKARADLKGPLLYIDVDAIVHGDPWPYLSQFDADVAALVLPNGQFASGTILIADSVGARELLISWEASSQMRLQKDKGHLLPSGDHGDQGVLSEIVRLSEVGNTPFTFQRLPVNLTFIFDRVGWYFLDGPVLIEHLQASREVTGRQAQVNRRRKRIAEIESLPPSQ